MKEEEKSEFLEQALRRYEEIADFESQARSLMLEDYQFLYRDPWPEGARRKREGERRPCITIRRTNQFTDHLKNEQRQNKPKISVLPVDDGAQEIYAKKRQGLIRHIQYDSKAELSFQIAYDAAVDIGRGWFRIDTEYLTDKSFDQKITINPIRDPLSVYMDPKHEKPDYSDCRWGFIISRVSRDDFEDAYPEMDPCDWTNENNGTSWIQKDSITLAEYFCVKNKKRELWEIEINGIKARVFKDEIENPDKYKDKVLRKRTVDDKYVHWYYISPKEIIAERELVCKHIPLVPMIGKENIVDGVYDCKGITRDLIDLGRMYMFWSSQETEIISNAPKNPYIGAAGQFEGFEDKWGQANDTSFAFLEYNPVSHDGSLAPPPQRSDFIQIPSAIVNAKREIVEDMKAVTGLYDASLGNRSNETSGIAIKNRQAQGETSNYHYPDNAAIALTHAGIIINEMIPSIYSEERTVMILGEDDEQQKVYIGQMEKKGIDGFGSGEYSVVVAVGPAFSTKREEAAMNMVEMSKNLPIIGEGAADLIVKSQDWPMKDEIAERAKRILDGKYPGLTAPIDEDGQDGQITQMVQQMKEMEQQLQQMAQEREQLTQQLQQMDQEKQRAEAEKIKIEIEKLGIEREKLKIETAKLDIESKKIEMDAMKADLDAETKLKIAEMSHEAHFNEKTLEHTHSLTAATKEKE